MKLRRSSDREVAKFVLAAVGIRDSFTQTRCPGPALGPQDSPSRAVQNLSLHRRDHASAIFPKLAIDQSFENKYCREHGR